MSEWYLSWSGGADSTATGIVCVQEGLPLKAAVYCEVMFDHETSGEVPEHRDFIYNTAIPWFESHGVPVIVLRSEKTALDWMLSEAKSGPRKGKLHGFPLAGHQGWCSVKRDCKLPPLEKFRKAHPDAKYYEGICADEERRIKGEKFLAGCYPLVDHGYTQVGARQLCAKHGLLSPVYEFTKRGGCFFCPNARDSELHHLYKHHPGLWKRLMEIQDLENVVRPGYFRVEESLHDIESRFYLEDQQLSFFDNGDSAHFN